MTPAEISALLATYASVPAGRNAHIEAIILAAKLVVSGAEWAGPDGCPICQSSGDDHVAGCAMARLKELLLAL